VVRKEETGRRGRGKWRERGWESEEVEGSRGETGKGDRRRKEN
jgi:hypothetical protein